MRAYKGFRGDLTCTYGAGKFQYYPGQIIKETYSKAQRSGLHCAENPLECLRWYPLGQGNRYFMVEASGSLDELGKGDTQLACTEMQLVKELSLKEFAGHAMMYMVNHPLRDWKKEGNYISVKSGKAEAGGKGSIAIARGENPAVRGGKGAILGLMREKAGQIEDAKLFEVQGDIRPGIWYGLEARALKEVQNEAYSNNAVTA